MLDFDSDRDVPQAKPASTVIVVRQRAALEVFCVRRHQKSGFLGGAVVFPGGKVDEADRDPGWADACTGLPRGGGRFGDDDGAALAYAIAAAREALEESAILPVVGDALNAAEAESLRTQLAAVPRAEQGQAFAESIRQRKLVVDTARLHAFARWVTPRAERRRFDTRFYVLELPPGQEGRHDDHETTTSFWAPPAEVLKRWRAGDVFLAPPTSDTLEALARSETASELPTLAESRSLAPICPHFVQEGDTAVLALPGDPLYPEPSPAPADPNAPTRFELKHGRFEPRRVE